MLISRSLKELSREITAGGEGMAASAVAYAGYYINDDYQPVWGNHLGHVAVTLPSRKQRHFHDYPVNDVVAHLDWLREELAGIAAAQGYALRVRPEKDGPPEGKDVNIRILGANLVSVQKLTAELLAFLRNDPKLGSDLLDLDSNQGQSSRVFRFRVEPEKAAEYGLTVAQAAALAASVINGRLVGQYRLPDEDVDMKLMISPTHLEKMEDTLGLVLLEHASGPVRLGDICRVENYLEPGYLNRYQGQRAVTLTANLRTGSELSATSVVEMVRRHYQTIREGYPGATINFSGEFESTRNSFTSLTYAFLIALLLIYLILATQFQSYLHPLAILSAVVFSLIGIIFGTMLSRSLFTVNSFIAVVGVTGVVVNDSLVLIEFINKLYRRGCTRRRAAIEATHIRLRPILLTTLTTTLGLLPMAVGFPEYSIIWGTMAMTFVTGLCTATFLTIFMVPVQWELIEEMKDKWSRRHPGRHREPEKYREE